jgi:preprotein translocase subunit SecE
MMTDHDVDDKTTHGPADEPDADESDKSSDEDQPETALAERETPGAELDSSVPTQLGATRYVLAGFFAAGMGVAYVVSKVLTGTWNKLADNAWVASHAPFLSRIAEDDRPSYTMLVGAALGIFTTVYAYRRPDVRTWTNEVASELAKVSWPTKKEVTNSTMVVIAASTFATVFLALLDRFWGFVTNLVYGS